MTTVYQIFFPTVHQQPTRRVGSIADYDPVNEQYGSISQHNANPAGGGYRQETTYQVKTYFPFVISFFLCLLPRVMLGLEIRFPLI